MYAVFRDDGPAGMVWAERDTRNFWNCHVNLRAGGNTANEVLAAVALHTTDAPCAGLYCSVPLGNRAARALARRCGFEEESRNKEFVYYAKET